MTFRRIRHILYSGASFGVAVLMYLSAASAANLVVDPSFELGTASGPENTGGWTFANGATLNAIAANAHTGSHSVNLTNGGGGAAANVPLAFETFNIGVTGGAKYTLTGFGITTGPLSPAAPSNNNTSFAGIQATFFSGDNASGTNLGTVATGAGNAVFSNHIDSTSPVGVQIPLSTGIFTAPAGAQSLQIFAIAVFPQLSTVGTAGTGVFVDDLDLEQVPEPASLSLLCLGALGLGIAARHSRKQRDC
jgi:PEP-CTERM motif